MELKKEAVISGHEKDRVISSISNSHIRYKLGDRLPIGVIGFPHPRPTESEGVKAVGRVEYVMIKYIALQMNHQLNSFVYNGYDDELGRGRLLFTVPIGLVCVQYQYKAIPKDGE